MADRTWMERRDQDFDLTLAAFAKIANAQKRGTLSREMRVNKNTHQIVVQGFTAADRRWFERTFGEHKRIEGTGSVKPPHKGSRARIEEAILHLPLRAKVDEPRRWIGDAPPRIELWYVHVPHTCGQFKGVVKDGTPRWRCGFYGCKKAITKTRARELGLLADDA